MKNQSYLYKIDLSLDEQKFRFILADLQNIIRFLCDFASIFNINQDNIPIDNNKNIKFFSINLIYIILVISRRIKNSKKQYLISKIAIFSLKSYFSFFALFYYLLRISINKS